MAKAASLWDRNLLINVKSPGSSARPLGSGWYSDWCMHVQLVCESDNFTGSSVPLIESLKSKAQLITEVWNQKNLTHLQRLLLFKDSSVLSPK